MVENGEDRGKTREEDVDSFLRILEEIHTSTNQRYGQIINNALQAYLGRAEYYRRQKHNIERFEPALGAYYDTFHISDEEFTQALQAFQEQLD